MIQPRSFRHTNKYLSQLCIESRVSASAGGPSSWLSGDGIVSKVSIPMDYHYHWDGHVGGICAGHGSSPQFFFATGS